MDIQILNKLFNAADDLNDEMIYEGCHNLVPNTGGVLCHNGCVFYKGHKEGCMLSNALSILDEAKRVYKTIKDR
jgi:hypothetical protein